MNYIDKLERKYGHRAIPDLTTYLAGILAVGTVIGNLFPIFVKLFCFSVPAILGGQVWRIITWIVVPPLQSSMFAVLIFLLCIVWMSKSLERLIGAFRMNVFLIGGILLTTVGSFIVALLTSCDIYLSNYHILMTLFMALALLMPEARVLVYFIIPVKMKWMLIIYLVELFYEILCCFQMGIAYGIGFGTQIVFALINLFLFFYLSKKKGFKQKRRERQFKSQFASPRPGSGIAHHKCAICGRTEITNPEMMFRYCSKCDGNKEYCEEHLFSHNHVKNS